MHGTIDRFRWTERNKELLKEKIADGMSARGAADDLGITRNAAIGCARRMGLSFASDTAQNAYTKKKIEQRRKKLHAPKTSRNDVPLKERVDPVLPLDIPFLNRRPDQCAQLYGDDPRTMTWCGHPCHGTLPYCLAHAQINYQPPNARYREPRPR